MIAEDDRMTPQEAARLLNRTVPWIYSLKRRNKILSEKIGNSVVLSKQAVEVYAAGEHPRGQAKKND